MNWAVGIVVVAVVAILAVAALGLGAGFMTSTITESGDDRAVEAAPLAPPADGTGIVYSRYKQKSGLGLLGWEVIRSKYAANVGFIPPAGCLPPATGKIAADGACAAIPVEGTVSGGGSAVDGRPIVIVSVPISERCFRVLSPGDAWPACEAGGSK